MSTTRCHSIGAIVVNFNAGEKVLRCLRALREQTLPLDQIVLVDNASSDGSVAGVREQAPTVCIIELNENQGLPYARNVGLKHLDTELVLSLDADIYLAPDCVAHMTEAYRERAPALVCPRILLYPEREIVQFDGAAVHFLGTMALRHAYQPAAELPQEPAIVGACGGGCLLLRRDQILADGGFAESFFFYFEDLELSLRLRAQGHDLLCEPRAVVFHDRGRGTAGLAFRGAGKYPERRAFLSMRNRWFVILTYYQLRTLLLLSPALALYEAATVAVSLQRGWIGTWVRAWWSVASHAGEIRRWRRISRTARRVRDKDLLEGGPIPLAPGFVRSKFAGSLVRALETVLNGYFALARRWIG